MTALRFAHHLTGVNLNGGREFCCAQVQSNLLPLQSREVVVANL